jgi:hypothetical protein
VYTPGDERLKLPLTCNCNPHLPSLQVISKEETHEYDLNPYVWKSERNSGDISKASSAAAKLNIQLL